MLALTTAHHLFEERTISQLIYQCVKQLFILYPDPSILPDGNKSIITQTALLGFAHGVSGISFALDKVLSLDTAYFDNNIITQWIKNAINYERRFFSPNTGWPDLRNNRELKQNNNSWCHGALGIGLAKSHMSRTWHDEMFFEGILQAKKHVTHDKNIINFSLCHSALANLNFIDQNSHEYNQLLGIAKNKAQDKDLQIDGIPIQFMPGLMTGRAGIVFQFLKIIRSTIHINPLLLI